MTIQIKLFGPLADAAQTRTLEVDVAPQVTTREILAAVADTLPSLRPQIASCRLAVNHEFAAPTQLINHSDELALIGMVSGG